MCAVQCSGTARDNVWRVVRMCVSSRVVARNLSSLSHIFVSGVFRVCVFYVLTAAAATDERLVRLPAQRVRRVKLWWLCGPGCTIRLASLCAQVRGTLTYYHARDVV